MKFNFLLSILLLTLLLSCELPDDGKEIKINRVIDTTTNTTANEGWLIMIYVSGTGSLEEESILDVAAIKEGYLALDTDNKKNIDIVILHDRGPGNSTNDGDWTGTRLYKSSSTGLDIVESVKNWRINSDQEENMGSKVTLNQFITWSKSSFNRKKNALIIWNHGGGLSGQVVPESRAVSWDTENTDGAINEALYINEIQEILKNQYNSSLKLDILGFDACLMGMVEIAYEFKNSVSYMVASPAVETGGWRYKDFISIINNKTTPLELSESIVSTYRTFSIDNSLNNTLSVFNLNKVSILKDNIDNLAKKLLDLEKSDVITIRNNSKKYFDNSITNDEVLYPYIDLGYFTNKLTSIPDISTEVNNITTSIKNVIVSSFGNLDNTNYYESNGNIGLSIFFSNNSIDYSKQWWYTNEDTGTFGQIDFCSGSWKELMDKYFKE